MGEIFTIRTKLISENHRKEQTKFPFINFLK
jgi:hypothetical protein